MVVVGGGNTAAADAIYLSRICNKVYLVHRRDKLRATAIYHQRLADLGNVEFVWNSEAVELMAEGGLGVRLARTRQGVGRFARPFVLGGVRGHWHQAEHGVFAGALEPQRRGLHRRR